MPSLQHLNCRFLSEPFLPHRWVIRLTTPEDRVAVRELGLKKKVEKELTDQEEARRILRAVNDRANQIRNPSRPRM